MLRLAAPMIVMATSFTVMQFVDRFMVSRLGTEALAAILPAGLMIFLPASFLLGSMASVTTFVSQSLGQSQQRDCANYCWQAIYLGLAYFAIVLAFMWPAAGSLFKLMGGEPAVIELEVTYFHIMLYAQFVAVFTWACSEFFMGIHKPIITMYGALVSQVFNVVFNYLLIFGKLGFPEMGIAGAAWGTFIGITVGAMVRFGAFLSPSINKRFGSRRALHLDFTKMLRLLKIGMPAGIELMLNVALWGVILFGLVGEFSKEAAAASSAVLSCTHVSVMPVVGISTALTAAVGKMIGRDRKDLAVRQAGICLKIALLYMGIAGVVFFIFREELIGFWSSDPQVISIGSKILICAAFYQVFHAARIIYSGSLRGAGDTVWLAIVSALGVVVVLGMGGLVTVKFFPQLGALGPWIAATLSIVAVGLANRQRFKSNRWMKIDLFKPGKIVIPEPEHVPE